MLWYVSLGPVYTRTLASTNNKIFYLKCLSFRRWRCFSKPPFRVEILNMLCRIVSVYTVKPQNSAKICSRRVRVYVTYMCQYREINKHVGIISMRQAALAALINIQESFHEMYRTCTDSITEQRIIYNYVLVFAAQIRDEGRFYACPQTWWCCVIVYHSTT